MTYITKHQLALLSLWLQGQNSMEKNKLDKTMKTELSAIPASDQFCFWDNICKQFGLIWSGLIRLQTLLQILSADDKSWG